MNEECSQLLPAVQYLSKYAKQGSVKCIAETDINLLVSVLMNADGAI